MIQSKNLWIRKGGKAEGFSWLQKTWEVALEWNFLEISSKCMVLALILDINNTANSLEPPEYKIQTGALEVLIDFDRSKSPGGRSGNLFYESSDPLDRRKYALKKFNAGTPPGGYAMSLLLSALDDYLNHKMGEDSPAIMQQWLNPNKFGEGKKGVDGKISVVNDSFKQYRNEGPDKKDQNYINDYFKNKVSGVEHASMKNFVYGQRDPNPGNFGSYVPQGGSFKGGKRFTSIDFDLGLYEKEPSVVNAKTLADLADKWGKGAMGIGRNMGDDNAEWTKNYDIPYNADTLKTILNKFSYISPEELQAFFEALIKEHKSYIKDSLTEATSQKYQAASKEWKENKAYIKSLQKLMRGTDTQGSLENIAYEVEAFVNERIKELKALNERDNQYFDWLSESNPYKWKDRSISREYWRCKNKTASRISNCAVEDLINQQRFQEAEELYQFYPICFKEHRNDSKTKISDSNGLGELSKYSWLDVSLYTSLVIIASLVIKCLTYNHYLDAQPNDLGVHNEWHPGAFL